MIGYLGCDIRKLTSFLVLGFFCTFGGIYETKYEMQ